MPLSLLPTNLKRLQKTMPDGMQPRLYRLERADRSFQMGDNHEGFSVASLENIARRWRRLPTPISVHPAISPGDKLSYKDLSCAPAILHPRGTYRLLEGRDYEVAKENFMACFPKDVVQSVREKMFLRLMNGIRCIDPETFDAGLCQLGASLRNSVGTNEYVFVSSKRERSEYYVMQRLLKMGLIPPPALQIPHLSSADQSLIDQIKERNGKFVIVDDASYSGSNLSGLVSGLQYMGVAPHDIFVGVVGMAKSAYVYLHNKRVTFYAAVKIPTWRDEGFSPSQEILLRKFLKQKKLSGIAESEDVPYGVLTFPWFKWPDNMSCLTGLLKLSLIIDKKQRSDVPRENLNYRRLLGSVPILIPTSLNPDDDALINRFEAQPFTPADRQPFLGLVDNHEPLIATHLATLLTERKYKILTWESDGNTQTFVFETDDSNRTTVDYESNGSFKISRKIAGRKNSVIGRWM